jgi:tetratricopeptide (TPR) repeat protein
MKVRRPAAIFAGGVVATCGLACLRAWAAAPQSTYSAAALYNAANAYARAGKTGLAILFYERAQWLAPRDPDIAANLHFVRAAAQLPDASSGVFERVLTFADPDTFAWLGAFGMLCIGAGILCRWRVFARRSWSPCLLLGGALCVALTAANLAVIRPRLQAAVVLVAAAPVRATPAPMGDELFQMREGDTVRVEAEHEDFEFVRTSDGREGWVARAGVAFVVPR